jgi:hypothetical protein
MLSLLFFALALTSCGGGSSTSLISSDRESSELPSSSHQDSSSSEKNLLPLNPETDCYSFTYKQLGKDVMPIGGWVAPYNEFITDAQYKQVKESGLNSIYGLYENAVSNSETVKQALQCAADNDVVYLVRDSSIPAYEDDTEGLKAHLDQFTSYSSCGGFLVADEPGQTSFSTLGIGRKNFRKEHNSYAYYLNAFPTYATGNQLSGSSTETITYDEYLESYLSTVQPQFLSYDFYGFGSDGGVSEGYFDQLYKVQQASSKHKIPFWSFMQACKFSDGMRLPNEVEINYEINTALAYGAKGIQYFCYASPYENDDWTGSLVDKNGNKTDIYGYAQKANAQIASMDEVLMEATSVGMMQYGDTPSAFGDDQKASFVSSIRELSGISTTDDLLVGVFDHSGKTAFFVTNNSLTDEANFTMNFISTVEANVYSGSSIKAKGGSALSFSLKAGEAVLVDLTNYQ